MVEGRHATSRENDRPGGLAVIREPARWQTHLGQWVTDIGSTRIAHEIGVTRSTVYKWVAGERLPRPEMALRLVEISHGSISLSDVYAHRVQMHGMQLRDGAPTVAS
jgi:DNA-binding XRE family transcriptional regulator